MILLDTQRAVEAEPTTLDYLTGIGTLVLGIATIVLGLLNYRLSNMVNETSLKAAEKDRKVHLADKRMEWITDFRNTVSELVSVAYMAAPPRPDNANELMERFLTLKNKLSLMGLTEPGFVWDTENIVYDFGRLESFMGEGGPSHDYDRIRATIMEKSQNIINEKWEKIKNLED